jgi:hypothetical protein
MRIISDPVRLYCGNDCSGKPASRGFGRGGLAAESVCAAQNLPKQIYCRLFYIVISLQNSDVS